MPAVQPYKYCKNKRTLKKTFQKICTLAVRYGERLTEYKHVRRLRADTLSCNFSSLITNSITERELHADIMHCSPKLYLSTYGVLGILLSSEPVVVVGS